MTEADLFDILTIDVLGMDIVTIQLLAQKFDLGYNQAARFMEYLVEKQVLEPTTAMKAVKIYDDYRDQILFLGLNPESCSMTEYREALKNQRKQVERLCRIKSSKLNSAGIGLLLAKQGVKANHRILVASSNRYLSFVQHV